MSDIRKCQNCGNEFSDGLKCPNCGQYVDLLSDDNSEKCPHCGANVMKGFMFCSSCNKRIREDEPVEIPEKFNFSSIEDLTEASPDEASAEQ